MPTWFGNGHSTYMPVMERKISKARNRNHSKSFLSPALVKPRQAGEVYMSEETVVILAIL